MDKPLQVLIVEDQPDDAELMVMRLEDEGFKVKWQRVQTEPDYLKALEDKPDLILADWSLLFFTLRGGFSCHALGFARSNTGGP